MTAPDTIRRMADANPVPDPGKLHPDPDDAERLFSSIERRRDEMIGTQTGPAPAPQSRPWYWRPAVVFLGAITALLMVVVPLVIFTGGGSEVTETPATTAPSPEATTTLPATTVPPTTGLPTTLPTTTVPSDTQPVLDEGYVWSEVILNVGQFVQNETQIRGVAHTGSHFMAVGRAASDCAQVWVSPDGLAWDIAPLAGGGVSTPCRGLLSDMASNGALSVAVGEKDDVPAFWISGDGYDWDLEAGVPPSETRFGEGGEILPVEIRSVAGSEKGFVAVGSAIWYSPDGREWLEATAPPVESLYDVASGPEGFFAVGYLPKSVTVFGQQWSSANSVLHSPDGQTWSEVAELEGSFQAEGECWVAGNAITHGPHGYVIAGDCQSEDAEVAYSSLWVSEDGLEWSQVAYDEAAFGEPAYIRSIVADGFGYVASGWSLGEESYATVWFSEDASSWIRTELSGQGHSAIIALATYEGTAVAVGHEDFQPAIWRGTRP